MAPSGPDFLCIGAQKAGTAWLFDQLAVHPQVWMPPMKEIHFFDATHAEERLGGRAAGVMSRGSKGPRGWLARSKEDETFLKHAMTYDPGVDIEWYAKLFTSKGELLSGDVTPGYSTLDGPTVAGIAGRFRYLKVIFLARDPVDRAWSALNIAARKRSRRSDGPPLDLSDWSSVKQVLNNPPFASRCFPSATVQTWRRAIPPERFFLGFFDELVADPADLRARIFRFLDIDPELGTDLIHADFNRKSGRAKVPLPARMRRTLLDHFQQEYLDAAAVLGGPAETWQQQHLRRLED